MNDTTNAAADRISAVLLKCGIGVLPATALECARAALSASAAQAVPEGYALVPMRMNQAMQDVTDSEGWTWEDLLAAACAITEQEHAMLAAAPTPAAQAVPEGYVLVMLKRPEGYEDVHPELVVEDAGINPAFEPEILAAPTPADQAVGRIIPCTIADDGKALEWFDGSPEIGAVLFAAPTPAAQEPGQAPAVKAEPAPENIPGLAADPSAFVRWAEPKGYDMTCHPLHFLFLNEKTYAARDGWNACRAHYRVDEAKPPVQGSQS